MYIYNPMIAYACRPTHREIFLKSYQIKPISDCIYHFPIDLEPNRRPFCSKSIRKWYIQSNLGLI